MSGLRSVNIIDRELRAQGRMSLEAWCTAHCTTVKCLVQALSCEEDPYGLLDQLAATLGVSRESLPRAA